MKLPIYKWNTENAKKFHCQWISTWMRMILFLVRVVCFFNFSSRWSHFQKESLVTAFQTRIRGLLYPLSRWFDVGVTRVILISLPLSRSLSLPFPPSPSSSLSRARVIIVWLYILHCHWFPIVIYRRERRNSANTLSTIWNCTSYNVFPSSEGSSGNQ